MRGHILIKFNACSQSKQIIKSYISDNSKKTKKSNKIQTYIDISDPDYILLLNCFTVVQPLLIIICQLW